MGKGPILLVAAAAGFAGGLAGAVLLGGQEVPGADKTAEPARSGAEGLEERLSSLERTVQGLSAGLTALQGGMELRERAPGADAAAHPAEDGLTPRSGDPDLEAMLDARVAAILEAREAEEHKARLVREAEVAEEWTAHRVERLAGELGLDEFQKGEMGRILREGDARRGQMLAELRQVEGYDRDLIAMRMLVLREETETQLSAVLTAAQLERYRELSPSAYRSWGGRPGG